MSTETRTSIAHLDALLDDLGRALPEISTLTLAWERRRGLATVLGSPDGRILDVPGSPVTDTSASFLLNPDAVRLMFPDANVTLSGQVCLDVNVQVPGWVLALTNTAARVEAGLRTSVDDLADTLSVCLRAAGLPAGSVSLTRARMFLTTPDELEFEPTWLSSSKAGAGYTRTWESTVDAFATLDIRDQVALLLDELARKLAQARLAHTERDEDTAIPMRIVVTL